MIDAELAAQPAVLLHVDQYPSGICHVRFLLHEASGSLYGTPLEPELETRQDLPRRVVAPLQLVEAGRGTRCLTAKRCAEGVIIPVIGPIKHQPRPLVWIPADTHSERLGPILCRLSSAWNPGEIAIEEIHRIVRSEGEFRIPDTEFPGPWSPLPSHGDKGVCGDHRGREPLLLAG